MTEQTSGHIVLFVGPTCVGKTTLIDALMKQIPDAGVIVSLTTRAPRPWETNGVDYVFLSEEEFLQGVERHEYYEWVRRPDGIYYASSQARVHELLRSHPIVFGALDIEGCHRVKEAEPNALVIFLYPDDIADLETRLRARGDLAEEKIQVRLAVAQEEMQSKDAFDESLLNINGKFPETIKKAMEILSKNGIVRE